MEWYEKEIDKLKREKDIYKNTLNDLYVNYFGLEPLPSDEEIIKEVLEKLNESARTN